MRVYVPATVSMLGDLVQHDEIRPVGGTAFAVTPAVREFYTSGSTEELEYAVLLSAARASLRLLATDPAGEAASERDESERMRRVVISADVEEVTVRSDLEEAVVRISGSVPCGEIASVHVDTGEAERAVAAAAEAVDAADLGEEAAELTVGDAEDHELAWYAPQEVPFLLELL